jgi:LuxR family maltose regulon positive regulatory protein
MVVIDDAAFRQLPGSIAIWRAGLALVQGDLSATIKYARRALELTPEEAHLWRGAAASLMGLAYWTGGELTAGYRAYAEGRARLQMAGYISDVMGCTIALTDIKIEQGRLNEARHIFEKALELVAQHGARALRGTADMYVGLSRLYLEHNDLNTAVQYLMKSQELGELAGLPQNPYRWRVAMARIRQAQGDLDGALEFLQQAEKVYVGDFFPNVRPIAALRVRVWVAQGRLEEASGWAQEKSLSAGDDLSYLREFEYITLARLQLVRCRSNRDSAEVNQALDLLERLLQAAQAGGRTGSVIEILLLLSLAYHLQGGTGTALVSLERALTLAEPEGYFRIFVDEGPPMVQLLQEAARQKISPNYVRRLLAAFDEAEDTGSPSPTLIEPLSERELQVLRLLGSEMSGPEIARQLMVSLNTLNTHIKNIYGKLGVNNRRAALRQAEELHLF